MATEKDPVRIYTTPLQNIKMDSETGKIEVSAEALVQEAEERLHRPGPPTDLEKRLTGKHKLQVPKNWWPEEKRIEVAALYAAGMTSAIELSRLTGVPKPTVLKWRGEDWWPEMLDRIHSSIDQDNVSKLTKIVDTSLDVIQDRLINGDYIYDKKTGQIHRKPVALRDANIVASTVVDKRQLLRGKPTSRSEKVNVDARLLKLAEEFAKFAQAKEITVEPEVIADASQG
jgi:hypothetical protein